MVFYLSLVFGRQFGSYKDFNLCFPYDCRFTKLGIANCDRSLFEKKLIVASVNEFNSNLVHNIIAITLTYVTIIVMDYFSEVFIIGMSFGSCFIVDLGCLKVIQW